MAEYMEKLLGETPLQNPLHRNVYLSSSYQFPLSGFLEVEEPEAEVEEPLSSAEDLTKPDITLADPKLIPVRSSAPPAEPIAPNPVEPIFVYRQSSEDRGVLQYLERQEKIDINNRTWEASQKEPLVEVPIKRTKQYFAVIGEMEEYSEKRAAKALDGMDGRTMTEKEEGIKLYERLFGGLRSLEGREKYQGLPPWEKDLTPEQREMLAREARKSVPAPSSQSAEAEVGATPAEEFRQKTATDVIPSTSGKEKERVVWRFEDVSWVKQRTTRPRKESYAGTLDRRVQLESGLERYGPFGIGSGIEGVGGVKRIIERGKDGNVRLDKPAPIRKKVGREIVV
jgi:hypothetical protein